MIRNVCSPLSICHVLGKTVSLSRENNLILELRRKALIRNCKLLAFFHQLDHLLVEIRAKLLLQTSELHPE
jgi:hypothetical protein